MGCGSFHLDPLGQLSDPTGQHPPMTWLTGVHAVQSRGRPGTLMSDSESQVGWAQGTSRSSGHLNTTQVGKF